MMSEEIETVAWEFENPVDKESILVTHLEDKAEYFGKESELVRKQDILDLIEERIEYYEERINGKGNWNDKNLHIMKKKRDELKSLKSKIQGDEDD